MPEIVEVFEYGKTKAIRREIITLGGGYFWLGKAVFNIMKRVDKAES